MSLIKCENEPIDCTVLVDRRQVFTFCQFSQIKNAPTEKVKINAISTMFQGQVVESNLVTAISFSYSELDHIPASVFTSFGDISRVKFYQGKLKFIKKDSFENASHLRYFEVHDSKIEDISSNAFEGANNIEEIILENCEIASIASDAFGGLEKLKKIRLVGSKYPNTDFLKSLSSSVEIVK